MKSRGAFLLGVAAAVATLLGCTHKSARVAVPAISFSKDILPIFAASCALNGSCHVGSYNLNDHIDLTDSLAYATITSQHLVNTANPAASLLYAEVNSGTMPLVPNSPLPAAQVALILDWIKQGGLDN